MRDSLMGVAFLLLAEKKRHSIFQKDVLLCTQMAH